MSKGSHYTIKDRLQQIDEAVPLVNSQRFHGLQPMTCGTLFLTNMQVLMRRLFLM